ncbi:acyl-CoA desaturase [Burkholderiaceae bacterium DAT-1]|nr:acyl-CoA desaturase [Burkholderiaceae bacterium DAT-1]
MTTIHNRVLTPEEYQRFADEMDGIRNRVLADLGEADARYIRRIRLAVRLTGAAGRILLMIGFFLPTWIAGAVLLGLSKILDNMELGHNVMHGQYDWMNDPELKGLTFEWDHGCTAEAWRRTHNFQHHTYTNVLGKDHDIGYGTVRVFAEQRWRKFYLLQPLWAFLQAVFFQMAIAVFDLKLDRLLRGRIKGEEIQTKLIPFRRKLIRTFAKDYLLFPLLAGPNFLAVLCGNLVANLIRNIWTFVVIFCGHFTQDAEVFPISCLDNESKGQWYVRQLRGSSNLSGSKLLHIMTGNLSHQIEHHLFPDIPARRYGMIAPEVREVCARYGQHYNTGSFPRQFFTVMVRIFRHAFPSRPPRRQTKVQPA